MAVVVLVLAGLALWLLLSPTGSPTAMESAGAPERTIVATEKPNAPAPTTRGKTRIPRVIKTNTGGNLPPSVAPPSENESAEPDNAAPALSGPIDGRENPPADGGATAEAIEGKMDEVTDEIAACLGEWMALDPSLEGKVNMGFQIGPEGLTDAWVDDHTDVPFGPLSCFGTAIYSADWTGVSAEPVEVTFPFVFTQGGDGGDKLPSE